MADMKMVPNAVPGTDGDKYIPMEERTGNQSIVYFTRDLSPEGLQKIYNKVNGNITGKVKKTVPISFPGPGSGI